MDVGISLPTVGPAPDREFVLDVARAAERLGFHSVWVTDHVILPADRASTYPYPESTTETLFTPGLQWLDPVAAMGVVAGATERVRIGTSVLVLPYRNPVVLANEVATLDRLSEGRIILGIGVGWMDEEFEVLGVPKEERGARTDEHVAALRALWDSERPATFEGRWTRFRDVHLATRPHTPGGPPILAGGNTPAALRRAGALVDGWMGFEVFPEKAPAAVAAVREAAEEGGRDPGALTLAVRRGLVPPFEVGDFLAARRAIGGSRDEVAEELARYGEAGVGLVVLDLAMIPPEMIRTMEWFAADVVPLLG